MIEIEVKILEINRSAVEKRLIELGAVKSFDGGIHAIYYDLPDSSLRKAGKTLRLRKEGSRTVLTLKMHISSEAAKQQKEIETVVSDFEEMRSLLEGLGYVKWLEMEKRRTSYSYNDAHVEIDQYHGQYGYIPVFMEIEAKDIDTIYRCAEALGYGREDCRPWDAVALANHYRKTK